MANPDTLLEISDQQMRIWPVLRGGELAEPVLLLDDIGDRNPADLAEVVRTAHDRLGKRVRVLLPVSWCYVHALSVPQRRPSTTILEYALEDYLPIEIETLACGFLPGAGGAWFGFAVEHARVLPLVQALDDCCELTDIGIAGIAGSSGYPGSRCQLWCDANHAVWMRTNGSLVQSLRVMRFATGLAPDAWRSRVVAAVECEIAERAEPLHITGPLAREQLDALRPLLAAKSVEIVPSERAIASTDTRLDLAQGPLAPNSRRMVRLQSLRRSAAVALAALLLTAVGLGIQIRHDEQRNRTIAAWEQATFARVFPGEPIPPGVALRITSEQRRLEGLTRGGASEPEYRDAFEVLRGIIAGLPSNVRIDLQEARLEDGDLTLRGKTLDHAHAEQIAAAFKGLPGWMTDPPRTDRQSDGSVQFFVHAKPAQSNPQSGAPR